MISRGANFQFAFQLNCALLHADQTKTAIAPSFALLTFTNNQFQFTVNGTTGTNYVVQAATNLATPNWISLNTNAAPFLFVETNAILFNQRFYRALVNP